MAKAKAKPASSVVRPIIRSNNERHLLEDIFDGEQKDMPVITSVGYRRIAKGTNSWIAYVIKSKGREVMSIDVTEPDLRDIAEESAKISFVSEFIDKEAF